MEHSWYHLLFQIKAFPNLLIWREKISCCILLHKQSLYHSAAMGLM